MDVLRVALNRWIDSAIDSAIGYLSIAPINMLIFYQLASYLYVCRKSKRALVEQS